MIRDIIQFVMGLILLIIGIKLIVIARKMKKNY